jgi:hypothetical protein
VPDGTPGSEQRPDPGNTADAINRYRDLAKWLITVFAAIGGLLVAGSQLSSLGKLDLEDDWVRLLAAALGLALALAMAVWLVTRSLSILRPVEMSLDSLVGDEAIAAKFDAMPSILPFGAATVSQVRERLNDALGNPFLTEENKKTWSDEAKLIVDYAAFLKIQSQFDAVWSDMAKAAAVAALGIVALRG